MKRLVSIKRRMNIRKCLLLFLLLPLCPISAKAGAIYSRLDSLMVGVRYQVKITDASLLPDSVLLKFCARAVLHTSTVVGGVESQYKFNMVNNKAFYAIPDSIVEILSATLISGTRTKRLLPYQPRYIEDIFKLTEFAQLTSGGDGKPRVYNVWADTLQLIPIPVSADSIYLKCYIEHPALTSGANSILLRPDYTEAALFYASYLVLTHLGMLEEALVYKKDFNEVAATLIPKYKFRNVEALPGGQ